MNKPVDELHPRKRKKRVAATPKVTTREIVTAKTVSAKEISHLKSSILHGLKTKSRNSSDPSDPCSPPIL